MGKLIKRAITVEFKKLLKEYPVVTILGPRQSGKTTLARSVLKTYDYCNLENPENRMLAEQDPKEFLSKFKKKVILDEIQRVPILLSYIQVIVDEQKKNGQFVLTGSHQLKLHEAITQSLAGRTGLLTLLPLSISELRGAKIDFEHFTSYCFKGFLPRVYDQNLRPLNAYSNYFQTYVEKDVRQLINLKNVSLFEKFIRILAGRVSQIVEYGSIASDVGTDAKTIKEWLSILEASFIVFKLSPYYENLGKRLIKSPKYYFYDVGLLCFLLGIENEKQVGRDPLVGNIFENLVVIEYLKKRFNAGEMSNLYFYRDSNQVEVDLILDHSRMLTPVEIKSSSTFHSSFLSNINKVQNYSKKFVKGKVVYSGSSHKLRTNCELVSFKEI